MKKAINILWLTAAIWVHIVWNSTQENNKWDYSNKYDITNLGESVILQCNEILQIKYCKCSRWNYYIDSWPNMPLISKADLITTALTQEGFYDPQKEKNHIKK